MALSKKALMRAVNSVPEGDDVGVRVVGAVLEKWGTPAHGGEREPLEAKK